MFSLSQHPPHSYLPPSLFPFITLSLSPPAAAVGHEKNWTQLRKQVYDNMSAYLARKEERIRLKAGEDISELDVPDPLSEPPDKKIKTDQE